MANLTPEGLGAVRQAAERNGVSLDAALALLDSLARGNGAQAQFNHPDLGGMGQWSRGGMIMIGDMFNQGLKYRVDALCNELSSLLESQPFAPMGNYQSQSQGDGRVSLFAPGSSSNWWPAEFGAPASSGAQNDMRYAFFPYARRLAIQHGGVTRIYDTGDHNISGFSQQQGGDQSATFTSQYGLVRVADLPLVQGEREAPHNPAPPPHHAPANDQTYAPPAATFNPPSAPAETMRAPVQANSSLTPDDIFKALERLGELRKKEVLTEQEFAAKKTELLARL